MKIYDGEGAILGRLASIVAKDLLLGEEVRVVNCEKVIISGNKATTYAHEKQRLERKGYPLKSVKVFRVPDRFVRKSIRGMLPWKFARGKEAFRRVMCYCGVPSDLSKGLIKIKENKSKLPTLNYMTVGEVCKQLGGKR